MENPEMIEIFSRRQWKLLAYEKYGKSCNLFQYKTILKCKYCLIKRVDLTVVLGSTQDYLGFYLEDYANTFSAYLRF